MKDNIIQFAICVHNKDCEDIELLKLYQVLIDGSANQKNLIAFKKEVSV